MIPAVAYDWAPGDAPDVAVSAPTLELGPDGPVGHWPGAQWGQRLAAHAAGLDARFVRGGEILVGSIDTIYAMFDGLDQLANVLNPETVAASVGALRGAAQEIAVLPTQLAQRAQDLSAAGDEIRRLRTCVGDIQRILKVLDIYGMNIKIAGALGNYRAFVDEMADKLKQGAGDIDNFDKRLAGVERSIQQVRAANAGAGQGKRQPGAQISARLEYCAGAMKQHFIAVPPGALNHMAALVAAQTDATAAAFGEELRELRQSVSQLAVAGRDLSGLIDVLGAAEGASSLQELEARIVEVGPVTAQIRMVAANSARMSGEIAAALTELGGRVENIDSIVREVKIISLNTRLLCHQQGVEGRAVAVIAVEIAVQASQMNEQALAIGEAIARLESCNSRLSAAVGASDGDGGQDALLAVMQTMRDTCAQADLAVERGNSSCRQLIDQLDRVAIGIGTDLEADQTLAMASAEFGVMAGARLDAPSLAWLAAHLPQLGTLYTMAAERQVHARFVPDAIAAPQDAMPDAPDDVDEDGLF